MWKRDETVRPGGSQPTTSSTAPTIVGVPMPRPESSQQMEKDIVNIGKSVVIKGELMGSEDLTIEGHVEGTIQLRDHVLTIGPNGRIKAQIFAKSVIVLGEVHGNVSATDKVDIRENGSVDGDLIAPRVAIAEGAHFRGSVDMQRKGGQPQPGQAQSQANAAAQAVKPVQQSAPQGQQPQQPQQPGVPTQQPQHARA
jgi:cytoskeletal protein CcmA (bactofilin family)